MRRALAPCLILVALSACAEDPTPDAPACVPDDQFAFYPPTGFDDVEIGAINRAMAKWNAVTVCDHALHYDATTHRRLIEWRPEPGLGGQYPAGWDVLFLYPNVPDLEGLAMHEFGHALGLGHVRVLGAVMCGRNEDDPNDHFDCGPGPAPTVLTETDLAECRRVGACP